MAARARVLAPITLAALSAGAALSLGRVFDGRGFVLPVLGAAVLPFVIGAFGRHRSWPTAVTVSLSALALVLYVVYALELSTTTAGVPLGTTWRTIGIPPISTSAFGIACVRSCRRVPRPPQRIATVSARSGTGGFSRRRPRAGSSPRRRR